MPEDASVWTASGCTSMAGLIPAEQTVSDLSYEGNCYLGIDAGSTTTKAAVVGAKNQYFHRFLFIVTDAKIINAGL